MTEVQEAICKIVLHFQKKYGRAYLYGSNGTSDSVCNLLIRKYGHSQWMEELKLLSATRILREELGGVLYFNNRLCACGMSSKYTPQVTVKFASKPLTFNQELQLALGEVVQYEEVEGKRKVNAKFGKRKKLLSGKHAAKVQNQMDGKVHAIEVIDLKIHELNQKKQQVRERWV